MKTIKASNYLIESGHELTDYHIETAKAIYAGIAEGSKGVCPHYKQ
jgi:hypothetical protein